jgi:hypothetical protein
MGSSGDDGDANLIYALYAIVPVSTLLLFWFVASGFNVQTKRARRQRLATEIARNGSNADSGAALRVHRDETSARGRAPPAAPRAVGREPSYRTRLALDLELAESRSREASGSERRGDDGSDVSVMMEGTDDKRAASIGSLSESKSDVDSAFEASVRSIHSVDPRRATMLSYVNEELGEMSGRYERLFEAARGAEATRRRDSREEA